ncbi:hypothetical protein IFM89_023174 [Coptis chinensis]|uniref:Cytochrome P450 n=1 Tax=Coptis chinensis TaxID=261450 RepID=A0A835HUT8_9MAGN|nr:hypothetical protein IFM89_023174 [Coptis chinensis]
MSPVNQSALCSGLVCQLYLFLSEIGIPELILSLIFFVTIHSLRQRKHYGLAVWPFFGMLPSFLFHGLRTNIHECNSNLLNQHNGTYRFLGPWFSNLDTVVTSDPSNVEYILKSNFSNFPKGEFTHSNMYDLLGDGIFNSDGETWRYQRKISSINFHSAKFLKLMVESLVDLVHSHLLPILENFHRYHVPFDLQDVFLRLTFDNVCIIALVVDPGSLRLGLPEIPFAEAF